MLVQRYLEDLAAKASTVLGVNLTGCYLAGSLALGDFDPVRSDIDIALVVKSQLGADTKRQLAQALRHSSISCPVRGLELVTYTETATATVSRGPAFEMELNDGPHMNYRFTAAPSDRPVHDGTFWYAIDRDILHQAGQPLTGPPAAGMFSAIPDSVLRPLLIEAMDWQNTHRPGTTSTDSVLNACRSWIRIHTGRWYGKSEAGRRFLDTEPHLAPAVLAALQSRDGGIDEVADAEHLLAEIDDRLATTR